MSYANTISPFRTLFYQDSQQSMTIVRIRKLSTKSRLQPVSSNTNGRYNRYLTVYVKVPTRQKRQLAGLDLYHLIADTSGGTVYETDKANIGAVVDIIKVCKTGQLNVYYCVFTCELYNCKLRNNLSLNWCDPCYCADVLYM